MREEGEKLFFSHFFLAINHKKPSRWRPSSSAVSFFLSSLLTISFNALALCASKRGKNNAANEKQKRKFFPCLQAKYSMAKVKQ